MVGEGMEISDADGIRSQKACRNCTITSQRCCYATLTNMNGMDLVPMEILSIQSSHHHCNIHHIAPMHSRAPLLCSSTPLVLHRPPVSALHTLAISDNGLTLVALRCLRIAGFLLSTLVASQACADPSGAILIEVCQLHTSLLVLQCPLLLGCFLRVFFLLFICLKNPSVTAERALASHQGLAGFPLRELAIADLPQFTFWTLYTRAD
jgi:hypothetical protein